MAPDETLDPNECRACRGTGNVISTAGDKREEVECPWCEGNGRFMPDHDAQAKWGDGPKSPGKPAAAS